MHIWEHVPKPHTGGWQFISSEPSIQLYWPSQRNIFDMQSSFSHWNWSWRHFGNAAHTSSASSSLLRQSLTPSHKADFLMHFRLEHLKALAWQRTWAQVSKLSSLPSVQSSQPSHFQRAIIHLPLAHVKWSCGHMQFTSSLPSGQSSSPSHWYCLQENDKIQ